MAFADSASEAAATDCPQGCTGVVRSHGNTNDPDADGPDERVNMNGDGPYELLECEECGHTYVYSYASDDIIRGDVEDEG